VDSVAGRDVVDRCDAEVRRRACNPQGIKSLDVHDVEDAPPVDDDFGETVRADDCFEGRF
jgi:hypothetical protein